MLLLFSENCLKLKVILSFIHHLLGFKPCEPIDGLFDLPLYIFVSPGNSINASHRLIVLHLASLRNPEVLIVLKLSVADLVIEVGSVIPCSLGPNISNVMPFNAFKNELNEFMRFNVFLLRYQWLPGLRMRIISFDDVTREVWDSRRRVAKKDQDPVMRLLLSMVRKKEQRHKRGQPAPRWRRDAGDIGDDLGNQGDDGADDGAGDDHYDGDDGDVDGADDPMPSPPSSHMPTPPGLAHPSASSSSSRPPPPSIPPGLGEAGADIDFDSEDLAEWEDLASDEQMPCCYPMFHAITKKSLDKDEWRDVRTGRVLGTVSIVRPGEPNECISMYCRMHQCKPPLRISRLRPPNMHNIQQWYHLGRSIPDGKAGQAEHMRRFVELGL
jgi:hypothetical protein